MGKKLMKKDAWKHTSGKKREEKNKGDKTQETEGILILDYVMKRPCIRLQMRCICEQIRGQRELLWDSFQEQAKNGMKNKIREADYNELDKWAESRLIGINLRSPLRGKCYAIKTIKINLALEF